MAEWQTRSTRTVYENHWIRVCEDDVIRPDGAPGIYGVVEVISPAVFVVAVTDADEVLLIRIRRYTLGRESLEVPGGTDGEAPLVAAQRELLEETGHVAESWEEMGPTFSLKGVSTAPGTVFLARNVSLAPPDEHRTTPEEGISELLSVPWPDVIDLVRRGEIVDGETTSALLYAAIALGKLR